MRCAPCWRGDRRHSASKDARKRAYPERKISTIALDAGFGDLSYFNRAFRRRYGMRPSGLRGAAKS